MNNSEKMFCFQCEQTFGGKGCTAGGVCGKKVETALAQDRLTGALIRLARIAKKKDATGDAATERLIIEGLFTTVTNVSFDTDSIRRLIVRVHDRATALGGCLCPDFDMSILWTSPENIRSLKATILFGLRGMSAYAYHADVLGYQDPRVNAFFVEALAAMAEERCAERLVNLALEVGRMNFACMEMLDRANTTAFGRPSPVEVELAVEPGPFIVVTGHDLDDLKRLLEQTEGTGVNVYTHGEMLPAHGYPQLSRFPHLKGNYGTAWQNQQKEFDNLPAPILWTTNCLMIPRPSYADRVWTTGVVAYPGAHAVGRDKDFTPLIEQAKRLGGFKERRQFTGVNGGKSVTTGFGHESILSVADKVIAAVKSKRIRHIFLVGGCDGARPGRNYYTEFVKRTPPDTLVLTLACGKFRFNDLDLGMVAGLPRLLDVGQCNDAFGAVKVALALARAFNCSVNDLPLSLVLSWYEQKAVAILLSLLALGIENIRLGPSLPAFVSNEVLKTLVEKYKLKSVTTPEADLREILNGT